MSNSAQAPPDRDDRDREICMCYHVSFGKIVNFIRRAKPKVASQISECHGAGTGCGWCIPFLENIHEKIEKGEDPAPTMPADEYRRRRSEYHQTLKQKKQLEAEP